MGWGYNSVCVVVCAKYSLKEDGDKEQAGSGVVEAAGGWHPGSREKQWLDRNEEALWNGCLGLGTDGCWKRWEGRNQRKLHAFPWAGLHWAYDSASHSVKSDSLNPMDCRLPGMEFSRQEYWSGLPFPITGDLPDPGIEPGSPVLQEDSFPSEPPESIIHQ